MAALSAGVIALLVIVLILKILGLVIKAIVKYAANGILGLIFLTLFNYLGLFGIQIEINVLTAIIAGVFGLPGVVFLAVMTFL